MPASIDVYREWLGIAEKNRPLDYYQLLRLPKFEDDVVKIRAHYRKMNAHVRKYAAGEYAQQSQDLLNELARAMLCLTDARRKGEYDASQGREKAAGRRWTFDELLVRRKVVDTAQLEGARKFADTVGVDLRDAVVQQKLTRPDIAMQVFAEAEGVPYLELSDIELQPELLEKMPAFIARKHSCAPVMMDEGLLLVASPNLLPPDVEEEVRLRFGVPMRSVLCTAPAIHAVVQQHFSKERETAEQATGVMNAKPAAKSADGSPAPAQSYEEMAAAKKQRNMMALMAFNFVFMGMMFYLTSFKLPPKTFMGALPMALGMGAATAGMAWMGLKVAGK
jgi:hypothetical protein